MLTPATPWDERPLSFDAPGEALRFETLLRACLADPTLLAQFDRLTGSNLSLQGAPIYVQVDLASGRTETELRRFAAFVKDVVWDRLSATTRAQLPLAHESDDALCAAFSPSGASP